MNIRELAAALNSAADGHDVGQLQELRVRIRSLRRRPSKSLFDGRTTFDNYAFHLGDRSELQFNIGSEDGETEPYVRFGVAFSLQLSQSLPTIAPLLPKIARFNEYVRSHPERCAKSVVANVAGVPNA